MADAFNNHLAPPLGTPSPSPTSSLSPNPEKKSLQPRIRRRNRLITSCLECRRRKLKCDKLQPCTNCTKFVRDCVFLAPALDPAGQAKLAEVKEKMGMLERTLEEDVARRRTSSTRTTDGSQSQLPGQDDGDSAGELSAPEDERDLEPTPLATEDAAYYDDADDDLVDLGIQLGKMRITERVGGYVRPRLSEELTQALKEVPPQQGDISPAVYPTAAGSSPGAYLVPGREYVAPSSSFFFAPEPRRTSLMQYLPAKGTADKLMQQYWESVHVLARAVHRPSFERQYQNFWRDISMGVEPRVSFQAVVLAALLSAVISIPEEKVLAEYGVAKQELVENFKQGTETTLSRANFLRTTKLETLQAFVMYLIPLCRSEVSRAHSALTGTIIRLAECMGLHRDGSHYGLSAVEVHVRRLVWYQICFLDIHTCEVTGPRPQIRREDFDTKFPLNVDDVDLESSFPPTEDVKHFTDMTISRIRFECNEMRRLIWMERPRIERKKTTLTSLLSKIQNFRSAMEKTYLPILDKTIPLHFMAMQIYGVLSTRLHIMSLNKYASNQHRLMPERLRQILLGSGVLLLEHSMTIETTPALSTWTWYHGAMQQYHTALLLLSELYAKPRDPAVETRVWRCLDFAFELPPALSGAEKSRMILGELRDRTEAYQSIRRVRAPTTMSKPVGPRIHAHEYQQRERERARSSSVISGEGTPQTKASEVPKIDFSFTGIPPWNTATTDPYFYMPPGPMSPPHGSDTSGSINLAGPGSGSGESPGNDPMLDIDWVRFIAYLRNLIIEKCDVRLMEICPE
ncbi:hypothetical protein K432DRAFT_300154 [Lepidopterella palustris CBS 459.81]|uniref:Zn(2)-C6 fungal-type domain-containing protein n=1 Tax=Lepidopterella palustris CBS 459.81 TaxID=1314670 RepID=A0A8E2E8G6_9PEZI|nr:hypothetical protein K432DRAFT_300154 [Lepidopterella palustris CBS 459.81]